MSATPGPGQIDQTARALDALGRRLNAIESVVVAGLAVLAGSCLALGSLLPYFTFRQDGDTLTPSVLTFGFRALAYRQSDGDVDGPTMVFGIAFTGLFVVVLIALGVLAMIGGRSGDRRSLWLVNAVAVLLVIGVLGVWATALLGSKDSSFALHQGPVWLSVGVVLFAVLAGSSTLRAWWLRDQ